MPLQASNYVFSVFGLLGFLSMIILLPMYIRAKNLSVCLYIIWTSLLCLVYGVNSIIWNNNVVNWVPVWCDISSRLITAAWCGNQTGLTCIVRRLYLIVTHKTANQGSRQTRRHTIIELCIGIGLPILLLPLQYVVESNRFMILEDIGCYPAVPFTPVTIPLYAIWPSIIGLVSALYAGLTVRATIKRKAYKKETKQSTRDLQSSHYWRLLALSGIGVACALPNAIINLILATRAVGPMNPFTWKSVHCDYSEMPTIPVSTWANDAASVFGVESVRWFPAFYALTFFAFFGLTKEARQSYYLTCLWIIQRLGFRQSNPSALAVSRPSPLVHISCPPVSTRMPIRSQRINPYTASTQIIASVTQTLYFGSLSSPAFAPNPSFEEVSHGHGGVSDGPNIATELRGTTRNVERSVQCENGFVLPPTITQPASILEASAVLRRPSLAPTAHIPVEIITSAV